MRPLRPKSGLRRVAGSRRRRDPSRLKLSMSAASPATPLSTPRIVAIVDPISTGAQLAKYLANRGYELVRVFSDIIPDSVKGLVAEGLEVDWLVTIQHEGRASATARALKGLGVTDVIVGSEPGVTLHVHLAAEFGADLPAEKLELRRNKYLQSEAVRAAGFQGFDAQLVLRNLGQELFELAHVRVLSWC